jgi:uncharacterized protein (TIGR03083 family)
MELSVADALLMALAEVRPLVGLPEVARHWDDPSALAGWSVGTLAAHLVRAPSVLVAYLADPEPKGAEPTADAAYLDDALGAPMGAAAAVTTRAEEAASAGPTAIDDALARAHDELVERLPKVPPDRLVAVAGGAVVMRLEGYLKTRLVEVLVHADDLAVSIDVDGPEFSRATQSPAIDYLVEVARHRHGDRGVLRALTRRERDDAEAMRVI